MFDWNSAGKRLCTRRILCFLRNHCLQGAANQLEEGTAVFFDMYHLQQLARCARFGELRAYVARFMPWYQEPPSLQALIFFRCLHVYTVLGRIAAGGKQAEGVRTMYPLLDAAAAAADPRTASLHALFHQALQQRPPRDSNDWTRAWAAAAERLKDLALKCPELKAKLHLPQCAPKSWQISLSGVRPVPRPYKKKVNKQTARDLACLMKEKRQAILGRLSAAPGADAAVAAGALGAGDGSREEAGEDASKREKKRKMGSIAGDASSTASAKSLKAARKD